MQRPERSIKHLELYLVAMGDEADPQAIGLYASACAAAGETARGVAFCRANVEAGGSNRYRIAWAIMENARGRRDEAVKILDAVEESEAKLSPLADYAAELRRTYLSEARDSK